MKCDSIRIHFILTQLISYSFCVFYGKYSKWNCRLCNFIAMKTFVEMEEKLK